MHSAIEKLVKIATAEEGYLGKKTNASLDDKMTNAGGKYTKFARDLDALGFYNGKKQGYDYCDVFADWCYVQTVGMDLALTITGQKKGGLGAGVKWSVNYYKSIGRFHTDNPQVGDQAFYSNDKGETWYHTGIVTKVSGSYVWVTQGNTNGADPSRPTLYGVATKKCAINNSKLCGYGTPDWSKIPDENSGVAPGKDPGGSYQAMETFYRTLGDVPDSYKPTIKKLLVNGFLKGSSDKDPNTYEDNVLNISTTFCRVMTILDRKGMFD